MFNIFKTHPPLPEESIQWLFDGFSWALSNFGRDTFINETVLVTPSDRHFPAQETSPEGMARTALQQVQGLAGLNHFPCRAINHHQYDGDPAALPHIQHVLSKQAPELVLFYDPQQVRNPQAMVANYAHGLAHHLGCLAAERPQADDDQWPHITELLAVYLGFGLILANTARPQLKGGCGGCSTSGLDRQGFLSELEISYALAIFCALKEIPISDVTPHIKSTLKSFYKQAVKDVARRQDELTRLNAIDTGVRLHGHGLSLAGA